MTIAWKPRPYLAPVSFAFRAITDVRNRLYDRQAFSSYKSKIPIICVGNITAGGSGKSPFCDNLAELVINAGKRPAILSRGYRGHIKGPHLVQSTDSVNAVGDEALMHHRFLAGRGAVVVAKKRVEGAKFIEEHNLADLIILDDGYQHRALDRDVNLLLLNVSSERAVNSWCADLLLPAGYLREGRDAALARADALVLISKGAADSKTRENVINCCSSNLPIIEAKLCPEKLIDLSSGEILPLESITGRRIALLSSIEDPTQFENISRDLGASIETASSFPDHHNYSNEDIKPLTEGDYDLVLTTSKDAVKVRDRWIGDKSLLELVMVMKPSEESEASLSKLVHSLLQSL